MNNELKNYYQILGITYDASLKNIQSARERELRENWMNPIGRLEVEEAYAVLSNPERRRAYDIELKKYLTEKQMAVGNARTYNEYEAARQSSTTVEEPIVEEPTVEEPAVEEPIVEEPTAEEPTAEEPTVEEPTVEEPTVEEPTVEEPTAEEPTAEEPTVEEPKAEEPKVEEPTVEEPVVVGVPIKREVEEVPKEKVEESQIAGIRSAGNGSFARWVIIGVTTAATAIAIGGLAGIIIGIPVGSSLGVLIGDAVKKHYKKFALNKEPKSGKITEVKTAESQLYEEYSKKLEDKIYDLLSKPGKDYELEVARLKYENELELLAKRIELKRNTIVKDGVSIIEKLSIMNLERIYKKIESKLELLRGYEREYNKDSKLSKLNNELIKLNYKKELYEKLDGELQKTDENLSSEEIKERDATHIKFTSKVRKRDNIANRMVLNRNGISKRVLLTAYFNKIKAKINDVENPEQQEEESRKKL